MKIREMINHLERRVPLSQQDGFDNSGVQCGDVAQELKGVLVAIDTTEAVVEEAIDKGCNLIVTHHPALFHATKSITPDYYINRALMMAIKHDIVVYASHTALDNDDEGINVYWARRMGLQDIQILMPKQDLPTIGAGVVGDLPEPLSLEQLVERMKSFQPIERVAHNRVVREPIQRVAYCGGSGNFLIDRAVEAEADIFITGEAKYNDYYDAEGLITLMTIGHFESELLSKEILIEIMSEKRGNFAVYNATSCVNPLHYI
ncbi:MAG: Nif3-like dinuclear metal center hexameric protein [Porphyromonas sp.]|nr:Nif3-like dinuclear metal center hexameric protein [Porphyromonas sp.]